MADTEMLTVFCYDVVDDRVRQRVARLLEARCVRVQKSVFEARLTGAQAQALVDRAAVLLGPADSLRLYAITAQGLKRSQAIGGAPLAEDHDFYLF